MHISGEHIHISCSGGSLLRLPPWSPLWPRYAPKVSARPGTVRGGTSRPPHPCCPQARTCRAGWQGAHKPLSLAGAPVHSARGDTGSSVYGVLLREDGCRGEPGPGGRWSWAIKTRLCPEEMLHPPPSTVALPDHQEAPWLPSPVSLAGGHLLVSLPSPTSETPCGPACISAPMTVPVRPPDPWSEARRALTEKPQLPSLR